MSTPTDKAALMARLNALTERHADALDVAQAQVDTHANPTLQVVVDLLEDGTEASLRAAWLLIRFSVELFDVGNPFSLEDDGLTITHRLGQVRA